MIDNDSKTPCASSSFYDNVHQNNEKICYAYTQHKTIIITTLKHNNTIEPPHPHAIVADWRPAAIARRPRSISRETESYPNTTTKKKKKRRINMEKSFQNNYIICNTTNI
jgi:hypothetical protein